MEGDLDQLLAQAKENLRRDGYLPPMLLVKTEAAREWLTIRVEGLSASADERWAQLYSVGASLAHLRPQLAVRHLRYIHETGVPR